MIMDDPARSPDLDSGNSTESERGLGHSLGAQVFILFVNLHGQFARGQKDQRGRLL